MNKEINLVVHPPMELMYALFAIGTRKQFFNMLSEFGIAPDGEMTQRLDALTGGMSPFLAQELNYFYDISGLGYLLYKSILRHVSANDPGEVISLLETDGPRQLIHDMMGSVCKGTYPSSGLTLEDYAGMAELVKTTVFHDEERKRRTLELLAHPGEGHARFVFLLKHFYNSFYRPLESKVLEELNRRLPEYQRLYEEDAERFLSSFLNVSAAKEEGERISSGLEQPEGAVVHLSFFKGVGWHTYRLEDGKGPRWFVMGLDSDKAAEIGAAATQAVNFFKTLADPKRIEIIRLLSERTYYGQELAEVLEVTPATISYHMTFLLNQNIAVYERSENRYYYSLNREVLDRLFQLSRNTIFKR